MSLTRESKLARKVIPGVGLGGPDKSDCNGSDTRGYSKYCKDILQYYQYFT